MALALDGVIEGAHMNHPDFRVANRIFATLHADGQFGMVALTPEQQRDFIDGHKGTFTPESGAWGRAGSTRVRLDAVHEEVLGEALTLAWQNAVHKNNAKRSKRTRSGARPANPESGSLRGHRRRREV
jgi:hypothetical protein